MVTELLDVPTEAIVVLSSNSAHGVDLPHPRWSNWMMPCAGSSSVDNRVGFRHPAHRE